MRQSSRNKKTKQGMGGEGKEHRHGDLLFWCFSCYEAATAAGAHLATTIGRQWLADWLTERKKRWWVGTANLEVSLAGN